MLWFTPAKFDQLLRTEVAYVIGLIFESMFGIYVTFWFRRNWPWLRMRIEWNRQQDNRFLPLVLLTGMIHTVDPVVSFALIVDSFPVWFKPVAMFLEVYFTCVGVTTTYVSLIVIDKTILVLAKRLENVQKLYAKGSPGSRLSISGEFFWLLEDANDHLNSVITVFHVVTLSFSVLITGCRVTVLHREKPGVALFVSSITFIRVGHILAVYHCGQRVQRHLIRFRRLLLRGSTTPRNANPALSSGELLNQIRLRREHSVCLKVFNLPLCLATGLWYLSVCSTMVIVTIQFAVVICESDGISC